MARRNIFKLSEGRTQRQLDNIKALEGRGLIEQADRIREVMQVEQTQGRASSREQLIELRRARQGTPSLPGGVQAQLPGFAQDVIDPRGIDDAVFGGFGQPTELPETIQSPPLGLVNLDDPDAFQFIDPLSAGSQTFDPSITMDPSNILSRFGMDQFIPDLENDVFRSLISNASAQGIDLSDVGNIETMKMQAALESLNDEDYFNSRSATRQAQGALLNRNFEQMMLESSRRRAVDGLELQIEEASAVSQYMFERIENLASDNIADMKQAKQKEGDRARRLLGRGVDDTAGVKVLTDLSGEYDKRVSRLQRDRDSELGRIASSQAIQEKGFALARANIEETAMTNATQINLSFFNTMREIEQAYEGNALMIKQKKSQAVIDRVVNIQNIAEESNREQFELEKNELQLQNLRNQVAGKWALQDDGTMFNSTTGEVKPAGEFGVDALMATAQYDNLDKINLGGLEGTITSIDGESPFWAPGLDIQYSGMAAEQIKSPFAGEIIGIEKSEKGFGNNVLIKTENGEVLRVSHLNDIRGNIGVGSRVDSSTILGNQGNSGDTAGPTGIHVDYTMYKNADDFSEGNTFTAREVLAKISGMQLGGRQEPLRTQDLDLNATQQSSLLDYMNTINDIGEATELLEEVGTLGVIGGRLKRFGATAGIASEEFIELDSKFTQIKSNFMKAISGAAVNEQEFKRLSRALPEVTDTKQQLRVKLRTLQEDLSNKRNLLIELGGGNPDLLEEDLIGAAAINDPLGLLPANNPDLDPLGIF